ncbi:MAG: ATP-binding protein, partial [Bdellovibrionia bacterium]
QSHRLYFLLEGQDELKAQQLEPLWSMNVQACRRQLQWGASEYELLLRRGFSVAENRLGELKLSLEVLLVVVVLMSLLLLWLGERALRPLSELIGLARSITLRGLRKEDKALVPLLPISRKDEVSQLAREFHSMATSLLEREKTVESQNQRLQQQNRLLREMGDLKERLRHAESLAAVGRMSAQVAHEVRNPLHSIGLEAEMAAERSSALGDPFLKQSLQSILSSVDRLQKITENYLKLSRLSRGQKAWVNLHELLGEVLSSYAPVFQEQKIQAHCQIESPVLGQTPEFLVWVDRDLMVQVLGNLLTNAIQAISENRLEDPDGRLRDLKGVISISMTQLETGAVGLKIQDNGPGISDSVAEKIFNPFFTTRAQGTGLGLSFIKKVIEDHGGSIRYLKNLSAQGACFEMLFPHPDALQMKEMRSPLGGEKMANSEEFQTNLAPSEPSSEGRTPCPEFY